VLIKLTKKGIKYRLDAEISRFFPGGVVGLGPGRGAVGRGHYFVGAIAHQHVIMQRGLACSDGVDTSREGEKLLATNMHGNVVCCYQPTMEQLTNEK